MPRPINSYTFTRKHLRLAQKYYADCLKYFEKFDWETGRRYNMKFYPSLVGLARIIGKHRETVSIWIEDQIDEDFSDTCTRLSDLQYEVLNSGTLAGVFVPMMGMLLLKVNHNVSDVALSAGKSQLPSSLTMLEKSDQALITLLQTFTEIKKDQPTPLLETPQEVQK